MNSGYRRPSRPSSAVILLLWNSDTPFARTFESTNIICAHSAYFPVVAYISRIIAYGSFELSILIKKLEGQDRFSRVVFRVIWTSELLV